MSDSEEKIMCPKCKWKPDGKAHWMCHCRHVWNTFETYGKCPKCSIIHKTTHCPVCLRQSPHADWYVTLLGTDLKI